MEPWGLIGMNRLIFPFLQIIQQKIQGKFLNKINTFRDFVEVAEYLVREEYTTPGEISFSSFAFPPRGLNSLPREARNPWKKCWRIVSLRGGQHAARSV
jgi:hypothetical protein